MADHWIDDGLIVYTQGRDAAQREDYHSREGLDEPDYPIVVLVNAGSASASEIVAGALQDHGRGLVMGTRTFGKGSVQTILPLPVEGGIRMTTALYYAPNGNTIQARGVAPDIFLSPSKETKQRRESDLPGALPAGTLPGRGGPGVHGGRAAGAAAHHWHLHRLERVAHACEQLEQPAVELGGDPEGALLP